VSVAGGGEQRSVSWRGSEHYSREGQERSKGFLARYQSRLTRRESWRGEVKGGVLQGCDPCRA
jgi:hypothetical protein